MISKKKNVGTFILGAIFAKSKHIQQLCEGFRTFCPNFHRFCPDFKDFHLIQSLGGTVAPLPPTPIQQWSAKTREWIALESQWKHPRIRTTEIFPMSLKKIP